MSRFHGCHRLPRAGIDPIDSELVAFSMVAHVLHRPARSETIALLLDDQRRGLSVLVVSGTERPDALFDVVDLIVEVDRQGHELGAVVLASVRPGGGPEPADVDRWLEASELLGGRGVELVEWFVVGDVVACPRDLLGEPPRWSP